MNNASKKTPNKEKSLHDDALMTSKQLEKYLQVTRYTLLRWRKYKSFPYIELPGGLIRYRKSDVDLWIRNVRN